MIQLRPMLAATFEEERTIQHLKQDGFLFVQPKIDGMRVLIDDGQARSRSWKLWTNTSIQAFAKHQPDLTHGWDGEVLPGIIDHTPTEEAFREAMSGIRSADGSKLITYYLFDNFDPSWAHYTYATRLISIRNDLLGDQVRTDRWERVVEESQSGDAFRMFEGIGFRAKVVLCPTYVVQTMEEIYALEEKFLNDGFEGAMLKRKGRGYKWNRATALEGASTKLKRFKDFEAVIDGVYPRQHNANEATVSELGYTHRSAHKANKIDMECVGGFHCHLLEYPDIEFDVGVFKGVDLGTKEYWWRIRDKLIGKVITCVEQDYKGGYSKPRTPIYHRFRDPLEL